MPAAGHYGYGSTVFRTALVNDLDPETGKPTAAEITVRLESPNGVASYMLTVQLLL